MSDETLQYTQSAGLPPGTLVHIGRKRAGEAGITVLTYDKANFNQIHVDSLEELFPLKDRPGVTWINIDGIHRVEMLENVGERFNIHPLVLEDIMNTHQRPKMEDFGNYMFFVLKMIYFEGEEEEVEKEQVSLILGENFLVSFQERPGDVFDSVRKRLETSRGNVRKMGADYLAYALMDAIVDNYFVVLERLGEKIEDLQEELINQPGPDELRIIHDLKRKTLHIRRSVWPLREVISGLERGGCKLFSKATGIYLRDLYDHIIQVIDTIEAQREMLAGMLDIYLSSVSNRMNEVMKVLTIIATIFIPLTFIAGIYGMNFKYMPELQWRWGYFVTLGLMTLIAGVMAYYFKKKEWL